MSIEQVEGPGCVAMMDQGLAQAKDKLRNSCAFVLVAVDRSTMMASYMAVSDSLTPAALIQVLDVAVEHSLSTIDELEEIA